MSHIKYQGNEMDKPCTMSEVISDLDRALDTYRSEVATVKALLLKQESKLDEIEERLRNSEKTDISTTHVVSTLQDGLTSCRANCQGYIVQIKELDRRVLEMETKFDSFAENVNRQLLEITSLLQDFKSASKTNENSINGLKKQIDDLSWINAFRDTLLKKMYQIFSLIVLALFAFGVLGFVAIKPYLDTLFTDKFVTRQELESGYTKPPADSKRK